MDISIPRRPAGPDPIARRIRRKREMLGWSLEELATKAGLKARSYVHHIESGERVPSEEVAVRLAEALGEDVEVFRAWARVRGGTRTDWSDVVTSLRTFSDPSYERVLEDPRHEVMGLGAAEDAAEMLSYRSAEPRAPMRMARSLSAPPTIPIIAEGAYPGPPERPRHVVGRLALRPDLGRAVPEVLLRIARLDGPFAYRLTTESTRRCRGFLPPDHYAVATREVLPLEPFEAYVVRLHGGVQLGYVRWDGERLLLLPSEGASDFEVRDAPDEEALRARVVGKIALLVPEEAAKVEKA
jgi:transcriptional regulator with XRE-family HTH domain